MNNNIVEVLKYYLCILFKYFSENNSFKKIKPSFSAADYKLHIHEALPFKPFVRRPTYVFEIKHESFLQKIAYINKDCYCFLCFKPSKNN